MARAGIGTELEGVHAVAAAIAAGRALSIDVEESRLPKLGGLIADAEHRGIDVNVVDRVNAVTEVPQGVTATATPLRTVKIDELSEPAPAAIIVLDHLQDPHNVGAVARSALAAGMTGLVVSDRRSAPLGATAFKAAAGALEHLRVCVHSSIPDAIARLQRAGMWVVGLAADGDTSLFGLGLFTEPAALVIGSEGEGMARLTRERCDVVATIPISGSVESLNASAAATLAAFEVARARAGV